MLLQQNRNSKNFIIPIANLNCSCKQIKMLRETQVLFGAIDAYWSKNQPLGTDLVAHVICFAHVSIPINGPTSLCLRRMRITPLVGRRSLYANCSTCHRNNKCFVMDVSNILEEWGLGEVIDVFKGKYKCVPVCININCRMNTFYFVSR